MWGSVGEREKKKEGMGRIEGLVKLFAAFRWRFYRLISAEGYSPFTGDLCGLTDCSDRRRKDRRRSYPSAKSFHLYSIAYVCHSANHSINVRSVPSGRQNWSLCSFNCLVIDVNVMIWFAWNCQLSIARKDWSLFYLFFFVVVENKIMVKIKVNGRWITHSDWVSVDDELN